ncbi:chitin-binding protein [Streptomyces decoyicus]|uniref:chitin-binding protein n=1 Tax=Streptomyces decoyicus TaxID=249567 RepID=UPI003627B23A
MRRLTAFLGTAAIIGGLVVCAPPGAHAITGIITYHTRPGNRVYEILDPGDDHCYGVGDGAGVVENDTPTDLVLYNGRDCTGSVVTVVPHRQWKNARFGSLQLSSRGPMEEPVDDDYTDRPEDPEPSRSTQNPDEPESPRSSQSPEESERPADSESADGPQDPVNSARQASPGIPTALTARRTR